MELSVYKIYILLLGVIILVYTSSQLHLSYMT